MGQLDGEQRNERLTSRAVWTNHVLRVDLKWLGLMQTSWSLELMVTNSNIKLLFVVGYGVRCW